MDYERRTHMQDVKEQLDLASQGMAGLGTAAGTLGGVRDPWKHRSDGMRCKTCMWFNPKPPQNPVTPNAYDVGRCRRHAPTMGGYPVVFVNDWCGDHRLDENRV